MFRKIILWIALVYMSTVIFGFSSDTAAESSGLSEKIAKSTVKTIEKVIEIDGEQRENLFGIVHILVRKSAHFAEFAVLGVLSFLLAHSYPISVRLCIVLSLGYCLLFAVSDEVHQLFIDGRAGRISDVLIDFLGSVSAVMAIVGILCLKKKKKV